MSASRPIKVAGDGYVARRSRQSPPSEVEGSGEYPEPTEHGPLFVIEELVAPIDNGAHRAVPVVISTRAAQDAQVVVKPRQEPVEAERTAACRGQFDGQGHAVEPTTDFRDQGRTGVKAGGKAGPVDKEGLGF